MSAEKTECKRHKWIPLLGVDKKKSVPTSLFTCLHCGDLKVGIHTIKISRYRLDMGELPINSVAGIKLTNAPSPASGLILEASVDAVATLGMPLYMVAATGHFDNANATTSATSPCVALAIDTGSGDNKKVLLHGIMRENSWSWTTGPGQAGLVYLSTSGTLTQTRPSGTDEVIHPVGWALSSNCIYFNPSMIYLTHV
ncbi:MAG: hypothetical protein WC878_03625 [Candidatus Paceibacterota bacterium]|jgi:hypothetical protein